MRKLEKPTDLPTEVFLECISNYRDKDLKTRLSSYTDEIKRVAETYEKKVQNASLHTLATQDKEDGVVKKSDMIDVYKNKFSKKGQPGRTYYDKLMAIPKSKKCPLCGQRVVSSLDHHLPKTKYPVLSVTPVNLVPACSDCNKII
jgi:5-methylcytosine-specific restriction endonuclease McrA